MKVIIADFSDRKTVENLMQLYLHDLSVYTNESTDQDGLFDLGEYFHMYWSEQDRYPYLCVVNDMPVGFALVRKLTIDSFSISEFFILHSSRRKGIATQFAQKVFNLHYGKWEVAQLELNKPAQMFWRKVISNYTRDNFIEEWSALQPKGPKQIFNSQ